MTFCSLNHLDSIKDLPLASTYTLSIYLSVYLYTIHNSYVRIVRWTLHHGHMCLYSTLTYRIRSRSWIRMKEAIATRRGVVWVTWGQVVLRAGRAGHIGEMIIAETTTRVNVVVIRNLIIVENHEVSMQNFIHLNGHYTKVHVYLILKLVFFV